MCISTVVKRYNFINGLELAISDTTLNDMIRHGEAKEELRSLASALEQTMFLGNFQRVESIQSAERLVEFSIDAHTRVGLKMSDIISHIVNSIANTVAGTKKIKFHLAPASAPAFHVYLVW